MKRLPILTFLALSLILTACQKKEEATPSTAGVEGVKQEAAAAVEAVGAHAKQLQNEFVNKAQQELDELNLKMAALRAKAQTLTGDAKAKIDQQIQKLDEEQRATVQKLGEVKTATTDKWGDLKADFANSIERFRQSLKQAGDDK